MKIGHRAFLDIEHATAQPVVEAWRKYFLGIEHNLKRAINVKNWTLAGSIVDSINTEHLVLDHAKRTNLLATAALLLGVSRVREIRDYRLSPDNVRSVGNGVTQWGFVVGRNLAATVRKRLHVKIAAIEHGVRQKPQIIKDEIEQELQTESPEIWMEVEDLMEDATEFGVSMSTLAASLLTSRLSNYGALSTMYSAGAERYMISAILDDNTCDVCEALDGQIFPVADGVRQATAVMDAEDPDSLADIAPWPDQDEDSVNSIQDADAQDLVDAGLQLPPYHPFCRCITVDVDDEEVADDSASADSATEEAETDAPDLSASVLATLLGFATGIGVGVALGGGDQELEAAVDQGEDQDAYDEGEPAQQPKKRKKPVDHTL